MGSGIFRGCASFCRRCSPSARTSRTSWSSTTSRHRPQEDVAGRRADRVGPHGAGVILLIIRKCAMANALTAPGCSAREAGSSEMERLRRDARTSAENEHLLENLAVGRGRRDRHIEIYDVAPLPLLTLDRARRDPAGQPRRRRLARRRALALLGRPGQFVLPDDRRFSTRHLGALPPARGARRVRAAVRHAAMTRRRFQPPSATVLPGPAVFAAGVPSICAIVRRSPRTDAALGRIGASGPPGQRRQGQVHRHAEPRAPHPAHAGPGGRVGARAQTDSRRLVAMFADDPPQRRRWKRGWSTTCWTSPASSRARCAPSASHRPPPGRRDVVRDAARATCAKAPTCRGRAEGGTAPGQADPVRMHQVCLEPAAERDQVQPDGGRDPDPAPGTPVDAS